MTSTKHLSLSPQTSISPIPEGLKLPEVIITRRTRTHSMNGRIEDDDHEGTVKFFCRSRGHGFIDDDQVNYIFYFQIFLNITLRKNTLFKIYFNDFNILLNKPKINHAIAYLRFLCI